MLFGRDSGRPLSSFRTLVHCYVEPLLLAEFMTASMIMLSSHQAFTSNNNSKYNRHFHRYCTIQRYFCCVFVLFCFRFHFRKFYGQLRNKKKIATAQPKYRSHQKKPTKWHRNCELYFFGRNIYFRRFVCLFILPVSCVFFFRFIRNCCIQIVYH